MTSLTPRLTWAPPSLGTPGSYEVVVLDVVAGGAQTVATFITTATSLKLPPGILKSGHLYSFRVLSQSANLLVRPFQYPFPSSYASGVTPLMHSPSSLKVIDSINSMCRGDA